MRAWPPPALHGPSISRLIMERARFHLVGALLHFPSNETQLILPREEDRREERGGQKRIGEEKRQVKEDVPGRRRREEKKTKEREIEEEFLYIKKKNYEHPGSLPLPPTLSLFLTFFLSVAVHKTPSSTIRATWPLGP